MGNPVTVVERVGIERTSGADFALADDGALVYATETTVFVTPRTLVWVDRAGHEDPINVPVRGYTYARLSPDGTRVALDVREAAERHLDLGYRPPYPAATDDDPAEPVAGLGARRQASRVHGGARGRAERLLAGV